MLFSEILVAKDAEGIMIASIKYAVSGFPGQLQVDRIINDEGAAVFYECLVKDGASCQHPVCPI